MIVEVVEVVYGIVYYSGVICVNAIGMMVVSIFDGIANGDDGRGRLCSSDTFFHFQTTKVSHGNINILRVCQSLDNHFLYYYKRNQNNHWNAHDTI